MTLAEDEKEVVVVSLEVWSVITTGIVVLIAIATSNRSLGQRIDRLAEQLGNVREQLGRVECLLEGIGLTRRKGAGKGRGDEPAPAPSRR